MARKSVLTEEQSKLNTRLEAHMVYICPECGKAFRTQVEWRQHLNTRHDYINKTYTDFKFMEIDDNFHECQLCFKWVENAHKTIALLQYHYFMHLEHRETYRCVHCHMAYTRRRALNEHLLGTHIKEIEKYESKVKQVKRHRVEKEPSIGKGVRQSQRRKDLLAKALMDIDLQGDEHEAAMSASVSSDKPEPNASEEALDRCLNAYDDIVRKEEQLEKQLDHLQTPHEEADLDALCQEILEEQPKSNVKAAKLRAQPDNEVVTIEIDALDKEEVDKLKKTMKSDSDSERGDEPPAKRRHLNDSPDQDSLAKFVSYLCPTCGKEIDSMDVWRRHVFKKHDFEHFIENSFKIRDGQSVCLQCHEVQHTTKRSELQKHCFKHLPYRSYLKCSLCERTKTSMSKMYNHIRFNHQDELQRINKTQLLIKSEPKWTQPAVNKPTNPSKSSDPESQGGEQEEEKNCQHCGKTFKTYWRFERHLMVCKSKGFSVYSQDITADALLVHLRDAGLRINSIWNKMQMNEL